MNQQITLANPICVALDSAERDTIVGLATATAANVGLLKVGLTAFVAHGRPLVEELSRLRPVFLDLKLHDIPAQVAGAMGAAADSGATFVTVHASGGEEMVRAAVSSAGATRVLAVTVLTSLDAGALARLGLSSSPAQLVVDLASAALDAGAAGLVCSPHEVRLLRSRFGGPSDGGPLLVVPGIRDGQPSNDQRRTATATEAHAAGADVLVVGRPITAAPDPAAAARDLAASLS